MPLHGLETIIHAFELLAETRSDFELHLCFWGQQRRSEGPEPYRQHRDLTGHPEEDRALRAR